jgi:hypothetical protein
MPQSHRFPADPLGLESLLTNEDMNRAANATPLTSPYVTPAHPVSDQVEVVIPPNIADPLRLLDDANDPNDDSGSVSGGSEGGGGGSGRRKRKHSSGKHHRSRGKRRKTASESEDRKSDVETLDGGGAQASSAQEQSQQVKEAHRRKSVSPVKAVGQPSKPAGPKKGRPIFR